MAEVAFGVEDPHQGRGIGTQLLVHLTNHARHHGVTAFRAFVLGDNYAMMRFSRLRVSNAARPRRASTPSTFPVEITDEVTRLAGVREQHAVAASLLPIFYPRSVAVIGASAKEMSIGGRLLRNLLRGPFSGTVYPVNPNAQSVSSVKAYDSVQQIPDPVDLAIVVVPARFVLEIARQCAEKGVRGDGRDLGRLLEIGSEGPPWAGARADRSRGGHPPHRTELHGAAQHRPSGEPRRDLRARGFRRRATSECRVSRGARHRHPRPRPTP